MFVALLPLIVFWLGADTAHAYECSNPCNVASGDVCVSMAQVVELGRTVAMNVGRQKGTCGGVAPFTDDERVLTWSRDPAGPFTPIPVRREGDFLMVTLDRPGPYFIEAAARDGKGAPDRLVLLVVDPATDLVRLHLRPGKGLATSHRPVTVRWVPAGDVDRFPRSRWPMWQSLDGAGLARHPMRLPPGRYDVEWIDRARGRAQTGITSFEVTGGGDIDVTLKAPPAHSPAPSPAPPPR
jgi:hypothetical protein